MQVIKRNGEVADFDPDKIYQAVLKAAQTVYVLTDDLTLRTTQSFWSNILISCGNWGISKKLRSKQKHI